MQWGSLQSINDVTNESLDFLVIFKHSGRCSISSMAKSRWERLWPQDNNTPLFLVEVRKERPLSNAIADYFNIEHQSPQVLLIKNGKCIYSESHSAINPLTLIENIK